MDTQIELMAEGFAGAMTSALDDMLEGLEGDDEMVKQLALIGAFDGESFAENLSRHAVSHPSHSLQMKPGAQKKAKKRPKPSLQLQVSRSPTTSPHNPPHN